MKILLYNTQRAIFQKLSKNIDVPIFDYYPDADEGTFPFIIIEEIERQDNDGWSTRYGKTFDVSVILNVWGSMKDRKKINEILGVIEESLQCDLSVDDLFLKYEKTEYSRLSRTQENFNNGEIKITYRTEEK